jgi:hypothetical protein
VSVSSAEAINISSLKKRGGGDYLEYGSGSDDPFQAKGAIL